MKKNCIDVIPVYEFRPILHRNYGEMFRHNEGEWIIDDGEYDIAFSQPDDCMAYGFQVPSRPNILWSWIKNGNWGASVEGHPGNNAWHYMLRDNETKWGDCWNKRLHPNYIAFEKAMDFTCSRSRCANGRGPEFHISDPYIDEGLLRLQETKEIVKYPKIFDCMYCGKINWRKEEKS